MRIVLKQRPRQIGSLQFYWQLIASALCQQRLWTRFISAERVLRGYWVIKVDFVGGR